MKLGEVGLGSGGWPGRAMVPSNFPIWIIAEQGHIGLTVGASGEGWIYFLSSIISFFFSSLSLRRPDTE